MEMPFEDIDDVTKLVIDGMLTIGSEEKFESELKKHVDRGRRKFVLDMTYVKYIDSLGIGQIAGGYTWLKDLGGMLVLARTNDKIAQLLKLTGLQSHIKTYATVEEAIHEL